MSEGDKKRRTQPRLDPNYQLQKQFVKAENLTEEQQRKIRKDAEKLVSKKARSTEIKIENEINEKKRGEGEKDRRKKKERR